MHLPELRNQIYGYVATTPTDDRCCVLLGLALTLACRQFRTEYRPICMNAAVTIDWKDIPDYLTTFYPTVDGAKFDLDLAPSSMTIICNTSLQDSKSVRIKILPILKFQHAQADFNCNFVREAPDWNIEGGGINRPLDGGRHAYPQDSYGA